MKNVRVRLIMLVAGLTVAAVTVGATLAIRRVPQDSVSAAGPLSGTPTAHPSQPPADVKVNLAKLPQGQLPQMAFMVDRVVRGGTGPATTVPGKQRIQQVVRFGGGLLAVLETGDVTTELRRVEPYADAFSAGRVTGVSSLVASAEEDLAAYAVDGQSAIYWLDSRDSDLVQRSLKRPEYGRTQVLAVRGDLVYFSAEGKGYPAPETYYRWDSKSGKVTAVKTVHGFEGLNTAGTAAADFVKGAAQTFCSAVTELDTGKRRFVTCNYSLDGFTPDDRTVVASEDFRGSGAEAFTAALDANNGHVRRQWVGLQFVMAVAEDDDHLLMVVDTGEDTPVGIIRCSIGSGTCELALAPDSYGRNNVQLLGART